MTCTNWFARYGEFGVLGNADNMSHVDAAVQAILHLPKLRSFLENDTAHRGNCRSLLKCFTCPFYNVMERLRKDGIADTGFFVNKWKGILNLMSEDKQNDPYEVLFIFLNKLRLDFMERKSHITFDDIHSAPISKMFEGEKINQVFCDVCVTFSQSTHFMSVELPLVTATNIASAVSNQLWEDTHETCRMCCRMPVVLKPTKVTLPLYLIVHFEGFIKDFKLEATIDIDGDTFTFHSCIVQSIEDGKTNYENVIYLCLCMDGQIRKYEDKSVTAISPIKLVEYLNHVAKISKVTLIYIKNISSVSKTVEKNVPTDNKFVAKKLKLKVVSFPKLDDIYLPSELPNVRSVGTQTINIYATTGSQTDPMKEQCITFNEFQNDKKFKLFTGLLKEDFSILFDLLGGDDVIRNLKMKYREGTPKKIGVSKLSGKDRLLMFLLRLRRGLPLAELSFLFKVSEAYVGDICYVMTRHMYLTFKAMEDDLFATAAQQRKNKPIAMKPFKNLRIILDGVSFMIERPSNFEQQGNTYSSYKSHSVLLVKVGISCTGATIFCSEAFEGSSSDKEAILQSGLLERLSKGDGVMTDRGYDLTAELSKKGCHFYKPPSKGDRASLTAEEEILTKALASVRIYCEHAIADIKDNRLLQGVIPITLLPVISDLVYIAAYLRNFNLSRIHNKSFVVRENDD